MANQETAASAYMRAEEAKLIRGVVYSDKPPRYLNLVRSWQEFSLNPEQIERLQMWVSPDYNCGTHKIFERVQTARIGDVAKAIRHGGSGQNSKIVAFTKAITPQLKDMTIRREVPPIIVVEPPCLIQGNMFDGNHRALAAITYGKSEDQVSVDALVGRIAFPTWLAYFVKCLFIGNTEIKDRVLIAMERLRYFNYSVLRPKA